MIRKAYAFDDILLVPRYSELESRGNVDITMGSYSMPIMMSPMDNVTTKEMIRHFNNRNIMACLHRYFKSAKEQVAYAGDLDINNIYFAVGSIKNNKDWIDYLYNHGVRNFLIDMAHGDCKLCVKTVEYIKKKGKVFNNKECKVIAGNVATKSGFARLQDAGADGIRVGVGSGSICATRQNTGFGVPLLTSIMDCVKVKDQNTVLIADGGIKYPGDIAKAIAVGADFVMLGKMLASTSMAAGECYNANKEIDNENIAYKEYHGMASRMARRGIMKKASVEGVEGLIPYTGNTSDNLDDWIENLRASLSYAGAKNWYEFKKRVKWIEISESGIHESRTHVE